MASENTCWSLMRSEGFGELEILPDPAGIPRVVTGLRYQEVYADA